MSKPSDTYQWSTNPGATSDPGATRKASGFVAGSLAPSKWFNWLHRGAGLWHAYVDNIHNEAAFLSQDYAWTGQHSVDQDVNYAAPVQHQRWLDISKGQVHYTVTDVHWESEDSFGLSAWSFNVGATPAGYIALALDLPSEAEITGLKIAAKATTGHTLSAILRRWTTNSTTGVRGSPHDIRSVVGVALAAGDQSVDVPVAGAESQIVDRSANSYVILMKLSNPGAAALSQINGVWVQYTMPGYRNG